MWSVLLGNQVTNLVGLIGPSGRQELLLKKAHELGARLASGHICVGTPSLLHCPLLPLLCARTVKGSSVCLVLFTEHAHNLMES